MTDLSGTGRDKRVCLLTGAGGTLGSMFCRMYADRYDIVGVYRYRHPDVVSQLQRFVDPLDVGSALIENANPVFLVQSDLTADREVARVVEMALARFDRIDVLINAAVHSVWGRMIELDYLMPSVGRQFQVNTILPLRLATEVAQQFWRYRLEENMAMRRGVINVSSIAGVNVYTGSGQSVYAASKAALNHLTRHMADEFGGFGVKVNATAPDSFPGAVSVESAAASIVRLDDEPGTGRILVVSPDGELFV